MPIYRYRALARSGDWVAGEIEAATPRAAIVQVQDLGYLPVSATEAGNDRWRSVRSLLTVERPRGLSRREMVLLTQQLAGLIEAGLTVDRTIEILRPTAGSRRVLAVLDDLHARIRSGSSLAEAMTASRGSFPRWYRSTIAAAERGGFLGAALQRLAQSMERAQRLLDTVRSALIYPTLLLVMAALSIALILGFVLPQFRPLFADAGVSLPWTTSVLMAASAVLEDYPLAVLAGLFAIAAAGLAALRQPLVREQWDALALRLPVLRDLIVGFEAARFSRIMGTLLENGVAVPEGLTLARELVVNRAISASLEAAAEKVREGRPFTEVLGAAAFPATAAALIRVGEESGQLPAMLIKTADLLDSELQRKLERAVALLTPALTIVLGLIIAALIGSVFTALLGINALVG